MSDPMIKLLAGGVLLLHGLGHGGALGALAWIRLRPGTPAGDWLAARSWLVPSLPADTATTIASAVWVVSLTGFLAAALGFWGILVPGDMWRQLAAVSAVISLLGILAYFGTWPTFNTLAALRVNVAVLVALLWLHWPPQATFGR
jgi:hypothetical protein